MIIGGALWAATGEPLTVPAALAGGVLVDGDHVVDYYHAYRKGSPRKHFVLLHGWEYTAVGLLVILAFWYNDLLLAAVLGHLGHLVGDHVGNRASHPLTYSVVFRWYHGFARERYFNYPPSSVSEVMHRRIPLWSRLEPWVLKVIPRFRDM